MSKKAGKTVQFLRGLVLMPADAVTHAQNLEHAVNRLEEENERLFELVDWADQIVEIAIDYGLYQSGSFGDADLHDFMQSARAALAQREKK